MEYIAIDDNVIQWSITQQNTFEKNELNIIKIISNRVIYDMIW